VPKALHHFVTRMGFQGSCSHSIGAMHSATTEWQHIKGTPSVLLPGAVHRKPSSEHVKWLLCLQHRAPVPFAGELETKGLSVCSMQ
jgi:hypothetical protein